LAEQFLLVAGDVGVGGEQRSAVLEVHELERVDFLEEGVVGVLPRVVGGGEDLAKVLLLDEVQLLVELVEQPLLDVLVLRVAVH
jgi:hypothetical protein